jgi:hypothetical protein
LACEAYYEH